MVNVEKHLGLVHHLAKKFYRTHEELCEYDDLISAGYLALCKAAIKFDETLGFQFSTFAGRCIVEEMKGLIFKDKQLFERNGNSYKHRYVSSLNEVISESSDEPTEKIEEIKYNSDDYFDVDLITTFETFDIREKKILELYFRYNYTQTEIAEVFNLSQVHVSRKIRKCLKVLKEAM